MEGGVVQVAGGMKEVKRTDGGMLRVRTLKRSEQNRAMVASGFNLSAVGGAMLLQQYMVQMAIVGGTEITPVGEAKAIPVSVLDDQRLGKAVSEEVYDALSDEDVLAVMAIAAPKTLGQGQAKN